MGFLVMHSTSPKDGEFETITCEKCNSESHNSLAFMFEEILVTFHVYFQK